MTVPRIPRQGPLTPVQAALAIIGLLLLIGALAFAAVVMRCVFRLVGWW